MNIQVRARKPMKNLENRKVRNRRFKIKRIMPQPKSIEVKQNGRVVRIMVLRRSTIYPGTCRRKYYSDKTLTVYI